MQMHHGICDIKNDFLIYLFYCSRNFENILLYSRILLRSTRYVRVLNVISCHLIKISNVACLDAIIEIAKNAIVCSRQIPERYQHDLDVPSEDFSNAWLCRILEPSSNLNDFVSEK
jgi:hypothetical protein